MFYDVFPCTELLPRRREVQPYAVWSCTTTLTRRTLKPWSAASHQSPTTCCYYLSAWRIAALVSCLETVLLDCKPLPWSAAKKCCCFCLADHIGVSLLELKITISSRLESPHITGAACHWLEKETEAELVCYPLSPSHRLAKRSCHHFAV